MVIDFEKRKPLVEMAARMVEEGDLSQMSYLSLFFTTMADAVREADPEGRFELSVVTRADSVTTLRIRSADDATTSDKDLLCLMGMKSEDLSGDGVMILRDKGAGDEMEPLFFLPARKPTLSGEQADSLTDLVCQKTEMGKLSRVFMVSALYNCIAGSLSKNSGPRR